MADWPEVNDRVVLVRDDGEQSRTRVEDIADGLVAVAEPLEEDWAGAVDGGEYELQWPSPRGLLTALTVLHHRSGGTVGMWWLEPLEDPALHQRRSYVRAPAADAIMRLGWIGLVSRPPQNGDLLDLSEGGARGFLPTWVPAVPGEEINLRVEYGRTVLDLAGVILRTTQVRGGTEVVVTFDELSEEVANEVRQLVFGWQRLARQEAQGR